MSITEDNRRESHADSIGITMKKIEESRDRRGNLIVKAENKKNNTIEGLKDSNAMAKEDKRVSEKEKDLRDNTDRTMQDPTRLRHSRR